MFGILNAILGLVSIASFAFRYYVLGRHDIEYPGWAFYYYWPIGRVPRFPDTNCFVLRFHFLHSPLFFTMDPRLIGIEPPFEYPAAAAFLYRFFYFFERPTVVFLSLVVLCLGVLGFLFVRALRNREVPTASAVTFTVSCLLFSYPFWFEFGSANQEFCIFLFLCVGTLTFCSRRPNLAAAFFGIAAAMKIFPFVFVGLFLPRKQYKQIAISAAVAVVLNVAGLWMVGSSIPAAYRGINEGLAVNRTAYMLTIHRLETGFDHSFFGLLKRLAYEMPLHIMPTGVLQAYLVTSAVVGVLLYFLRIWKLPVLNQIFCLYIVAVTFPPTSHDYTLIHLYVPLALLILYTVDFTRREGRLPDVWPAFICLVIACSSENELVYNAMAIGAQVKCLALAWLFIEALRKPWVWPSLECNTDNPSRWAAVAPRSVLWGRTA